MRINKSMANAIIEKAKERFEQSHSSLAREFSAIRAGRANASLLDRIQVHAINASDLGINPANDGSVIRLVIPALTEETRKELAKEVKKAGENAKVAIRNIRRDAMDEAKKQEKAKEITEDELKVLEKDIQKATDDAVKHIDAMTANKEKELLEV